MGPPSPVGCNFIFQKSGKSKGTTFIETNTVFFACRGMSIFAAQTKHRQILQWK